MSMAEWYLTGLQYASIGCHSSTCGRLNGSWETPISMNMRLSGPRFSRYFTELGRAGLWQLAAPKDME
ncbi:MAG: hypothetical protein QOF15_1199, partial [Mycobacterium sp.]|nr:hypothetical protein [Mycobacterium sp.]